MYRWIVSVSATTPSSIASTIARIDASGVRRSCEIAAKRWRRPPPSRGGRSISSRRSAMTLKSRASPASSSGPSGTTRTPKPAAGDPLWRRRRCRGRPGRLLGGERGERDGDDGREGEQQAQQPEIVRRDEHQPGGDGDVGEGDGQHHQVGQHQARSDAAQAEARRHRDEGVADQDRAAAEAVKKTIRSRRSEPGMPMTAQLTRAAPTIAASSATRGPAYVVIGSRATVTAPACTRRPRRS